MWITYSIFCDFDGTISQTDVTDVLLGAYALPAWHDIEESWQAGRIGARECMREQVALLRCDAGELDALADGVAIDPRFPAFVAACREAAIPVTVLSDGLDYVIGRVLRNHGLADLPVRANRLRRLGTRRYALSFPYGRTPCLSASGTCKCALMRALRPSGSQAILIGDGASDFCAAREAADFVFAKDALLDYCRQSSLPHAAYTDFSDVQRLLFNRLHEQAAAITQGTGHSHERFSSNG